MSSNEEAILGSFAWSENRAVLHTDVDVSIEGICFGAETY
jgi:predicted NAD/FAD-binding protein